MSTALLRPALVLGLLSIVGPFAIDMYLPAMPTIAADLHASIPVMQSTLTAYFIAFGLAQLVYGPWADQAGRRLPMTAGVLVFLIGSVICTFAPTVEVLTVGRFVQGLGAAAVMVLPRAVIRDLHTGHAATQMMAAIMLVISISPMLAPLAGSGVLAVAGWRTIFGVLMVAGVVSLLLIRFALPETLAPTARQPIAARALFSGAATLLTDRTFLGLTLLGGFGMASFFVFIASASFVYTQAFGLSPTGFSLAFAVNAVGFFAASQFAATLGQRFGATRVVVWAAAGFAFCTVALLGLGLAGLASLPVTMAGLFLGNAFLGLVIPTAMVLALDAHGRIAGLASSLGGTMQMLLGGAMIAAAGPFFDGSVVPMLATIAVCGTMAFLLSQLVVRRRAQAAA